MQATYAHARTSCTHFGAARQAPQLLSDELLLQGGS